MLRWRYIFAAYPLSAQDLGGQELAGGFGSIACSAESQLMTL
jgi:hypothetical protein